MIPTQTVDADPERSQKVLAKDLARVYAREIALALVAGDADAAGNLARDARERAQREDATALRVESGTMGSNMKPADYRAGARRDRDLADWLERS